MAYSLWLIDYESYTLKNDLVKAVWNPSKAIVEQLGLNEFPALMLKKPASKIVNWVENEDDKQWKEVVIPVEEWGKLVPKMDIEVGFTHWPI